VKTKLVSLLLEENKKKVMGMIETERNGLGISFSNKKKRNGLGHRMRTYSSTAKGSAELRKNVMSKLSMPAASAYWRGI
jgi:UTP-glucose-1-phosphate uridylyltransferase